MHSLKSPGDGKAMALPEIFLPGGDNAIVIRNAKDGSALWEVDLNSGADVAKVYEAPPVARLPMFWPMLTGRR
jgi:hypothetical protein